MTPPLPHLRRVLMTADTIGGVWTYALDLIRGLGGFGVTVDLATMGAPLQPHQRAELRALGAAVQLHESEFKLEWMDDPWTDVAAAGTWLLELERELQPNLIHLNGYAHAALPWRAPVVVVAHSCVLSWWRAVKRTPPPHSWHPYQRMVRAGLARADLVVAPTRAMLGALEENYGRISRGRVIANGRDPLMPFAANPDRVEAGVPAGLRLPRGSDDGSSPPGTAGAAEAAPPARKREVVLGVGRLWDEAKNAQALAAVAAELPWPVRLAGATRAPNGAATTLPHVELLGHCSAAELAREYGDAAIYALPARYEPFGLSVLEAAHAECALVLGDIASLRELWAGAAVFVPPDDAPALRHALLGLIDDPYLRRALGRRARRRAQRYGVPRMTAAYLSAYAELTARARPHAEPVAASFA